jgi:hypothetical protein
MVEERRTFFDAAYIGLLGARRYRCSICWGILWRPAGIELAWHAVAYTIQLTVQSDRPADF